MYKSIDGGITWSSLGLEKTQHIGRIVVHPTNPNIVYVAAVGATWGSNPERGLYKTIDGGKTWQQSQSSSATRRASSTSRWIRVIRIRSTRHRGSACAVPYFLKSGGPGSALWKTTDGGKTLARDQGGRISGDGQRPHEHRRSRRAIRTSSM